MIGQSKERERYVEQAGGVPVLFEVEALLELVRLPLFSLFHDYLGKNFLLLGEICVDKRRFNIAVN